MLSNRVFRISLMILIWLSIIFVASLVDFIFQPIAIAIRLLVVPLMLCGFLYYLLRPLVELLRGWKVPNTLAVVIVLSLLVLIIIGSWLLVWPTLVKQTTTFVDSLPEVSRALQSQYDSLRSNELFRSILPEDTTLLSRFSDTFSDVFTALTSYAGKIFDWAVNIVVALSIIPILLFFMLKHSDRVPKRIVSIVPDRYRTSTEEIISEIDGALSGFIKGRVISTVLMGILIYIGFLIIQLPYSLLLTLIATLLNLIPYIGPIVGTIPVIIVGLTVSPWITFWAVLIIIIAQQIESAFLAPYAYGKNMDIHPLTTVILILAGAEMAGIIGLLLAIPVYMIIKILVQHIYSLYVTDHKQPDGMP